MADLLTCQYCGKAKPDVHLTIDPYAFDVDNREVECQACNDCLSDRRDEI